MDLWGYASDIAPYYMASLFALTLQLTNTHLVFEAVEWILHLRGIIVLSLRVVA
jgi:hypothetical protein